MATTNPGQPPLKQPVLPPATFYEENPDGAIRGTNLNENLAMKGLMVSHQQLGQIKQYLTLRLIQKARNGEWSKVFEEAVNINPRQKKQVIDEVIAKFEPQFGWNRIDQFNKSWVNLTLSKLLSRAKENHNRGRKERQKLSLAQKHKEAAIRKVSTQKTLRDVPPPPQRSSRTLNNDQKDAAPKLNQNTTLSQDPTPRPNQISTFSPGLTLQPDNDLALRIQVAKVADKTRRQGNITLLLLPPLYSCTTAQYVDLTESASIRGPSQALNHSNSPITIPTPKYPIQAIHFQSGSAFQAPSLSQSPSLINKKFEIKPELIYQQMTLVVINNIFKPESSKDEPWEDILVEYLTEKGSSKDFNRLLSSDFSLAKFKAKLADSAQSPFKFDEELHELIYTGWGPWSRGPLRGCMAYHLTASCQ